MNARQTSFQLDPTTEALIAFLKDRGYGTTTNIIRTAIDRMAKQEGETTMSAKVYRYEVTYRTKDGVDIIKNVYARNEFEARQLAGAFNEYVISIINLDR